jgi:DNA-binding transcriptional regulator YhcF (GntR family)
VDQAGAGSHPSDRIADEIKHRIIAGELRPGDRVPSTRAIVREWGVAMATATRVLTMLRREGLVRAVPGSGTVVSDRRPESDRPRAIRRDAGAPEQELSRARIVRVALAVADAEGLTAVSMRRVATGLGVATMSLYHHVPGKEDLVHLMADAAFGEDDLPEQPPGWRARLELICRLHWTIYRRHPWLAQVVSLTRPLQSGNAMAHTEWTMRAVDGLGLDLSTVLHVAALAAGYVRGIAVNLGQEAEASQDTGVDEERWLNENPVLGTMLASGAFPLLSSTSARPDVRMDLETLFEFGLQRLLDGLSVLIDGEAP